MTILALFVAVVDDVVKSFLENNKEQQHRRLEFAREREEEEEIHGQAIM